MLAVLRRCDTLQCCTDGIIATCAGLVSAAVELGKSQESPVKAPVRYFMVVGAVVICMDGVKRTVNACI